ncbi:non-ribosomal peptide synthetase [Methylovulum psychrotolerans]|uniref:Non-ribosomal peptide synthetase n=1 Tax=Methylovulum psychrotolerans TaxID=1704499 RepID=A0A1Z4C2L0_9GAMM|nr:non-ribosomal peptide synthetase [Methylovulum psychrotolerans]ASF47776.1 non-ribosomal peptide synthetase [Methylovulum psychrotolerans]
MQDATVTPDASQQKRARLIAKLHRPTITDTPIKARPTPGNTPLSYGQEALWLMSQLDPDNPVYNVAGALAFNGALNVAALRQSLAEVQRRHKILHSRFGKRSGILTQQPDAGGGLAWSTVDLSHLPSAQAPAVCQQCAEVFTRIPFALDKAAPLRALLITLHPHQQVLVVVLHHIVADRWSVAILMREVASLYQRFASGLPSLLPELALHYGDFAFWQRQQGDTAQAHSAYWQQKLQGLAPLLALPTDYPRPPVFSYRGDLYHFTLPDTVTADIHRLAKQHNATLFMVMAAALQVLLSRYTHSRDIAIGYTSAGRNQTQTAELIGFFVNTLVLRGQLDDDATFAGLLAAVRSQALADQAHQDIAFGQLLEAVNPVRNTSHAPLFQVLLTVQNAPKMDFRLPGLSVTPLPLASKTAQFDLTFLFEEQDGQLQGTIEYSTDLFAAATLARLAGHLETLLTALVVHPQQALKHAPLLTDAEWQQLVLAWNPEQPLEATLLPLPQQFTAQAQATPNNTALVFAEETITYRELNGRAEHLAQTLQRLGVRPESRVGVCAERSVDLVVAVLAVLKAGAAYLPLDPAYPQERLNFMVKDAAVSLLLCQTAFIGNFQGLDCPLVTIGPAANGHTGAVLTLTANLDNTAYIIYTSGSSGQPKGVAVSHRNLLHSTLARGGYYGDAPSCFLLLSSFAFDSSVAGIFWTLSHGGCLCVPETADTANPVALAKLISRHQVSHLLALPSLYAALADTAAAGQLQSLRTVIVAGEACPGAVANRHHERLPQVRFVNEYGPTEATVWSSAYQSQTLEPAGILPIGRAIDRVQLYLLDRHYRPVPIGVTGEICIGGAGLAQGYGNRPDLTAEKFIPNPFGLPGSRLYKTGDWAKYRSDGNIDFLGRGDGQVKIRGFRIELGEIESQLAVLPGIRAAAVVVREDQPGDQRLVAYLLADSGWTVSGLRQSLAAVLPDYMIPSAFVGLNEFPLTPNGKLDRLALPTPDREALTAGAYAAPQGEAETVLAQLWQDLLGVGQVGRYDHFFELGGHSLLAIGLIERLQQQGFCADVMNVFSLPVLADMAATLQAATSPSLVADTAQIPSDAQMLTPAMLALVTLTQAELDALCTQVPGGAANIQDVYPLAPLQEGILFHHLLATGSDAYLKRAMLRFATRERLDSFLNALQTVINRHDILRTAVHWQDLPQPVQVVQRQAVLPVITLAGAADTEALAALSAQTDPGRLVMDLHHAPLFAAYTLFDSAADNWLLALVNHHLIDDNYTLQLILTEINQIFLGQGGQLLPPVPYRQFIAHLLSVPDSGHEAYFRSQLGDIDEPCAPFGVLDIQGNGQHLHEAKLPLSADLAQRLYGTARQQGVTAAVLFHAAWAQVLGQCTGRDEVVFGTVLSGRLQAQTGASQALGVFINTLPIRLSLTGHSAQQLLADCYQRLGGLLAHEHAALALAQRCSAVAAGLPLFTSLLNYRHSNLVAADTGNLFAWPGIALLSTEEHTNYPITLCIDDLGDGFRLTVQCADGIAAERVVAYLETALESLTTALGFLPDYPANLLNILPDAEREQVLADFNTPLAAYPQALCLHQQFERQALATPDAIALVYEGQTLSYGGLNRLAGQLAQRLRALGICPDDRVGLCAERSLDMVVGLLAILKAGGAYLPLDPAYPDERLAYLLDDSQPVALLTQTALQPRLAAMLPRPLPLIVMDAPYRADAEELLAAEVSPEHLAYVIYTSGSTGQPKGVMVSHANATRLFAATHDYFHCTAADVWTLFHSVAFDFSVWELWGALLSGGRLVIVPQDTARNPDSFYRLLCREQVSILNQTPSAFRQLIAAQARNPLPHQLRTIIFGGEALDFRSLAPWLASNPLARTALVNMYGITETTVHATYRLLSEADILAGTASNIGKPLPDLAFYLLNPHGQPVPLGAVGEIHIGGAGVARGYLNRPELSTERFIQNPFCQSAGRLYKTGDLGRWLADGTIEYWGRNDCQVKIRGFRIELGEIEACLCQCPDIREAVVIAREDVPGDKRLVAYLIAQPGHTPDPAALRQQLARHLADYMLPSAFVMLEQFPLTANGKLARKALPVPDGGSVAARAYQAPQSPSETVIAQLWQELLHLQQVGRYDHFFELGGHSLLVVALIERLRQHGLSASVRAVFTAPVLADLAAQLDIQQLPQADIAVPPNLISADCTALTPDLLPLVSLSQTQLDGLVGQVPGGAANIQDIYPLGPLQEGILFHHLLGAGTPGAAYLQRSIITFTTRGAVDNFLSALQTVINRHDILRTAVHWADLPQPVQVVQRQAPLPIINLTAAATEDALQSLLAQTEPSRQGMDLHRAPLFAAYMLFDPSAPRWLLALLNHHLVDDNYTLQLVLAEIQQILQGHSAALPPPLPYRQYIAHVASVPASVHQAYFSRQLAAIDSPTAPFGILDTQGDGCHIREAVQTLSSPLALRIRRSAREHGVTAAAVCHAAWAQVLAQCTGRDTVVFGTVLSGRLQGQAGTAQALGVFINTLPLCIRLDGHSAASLVSDSQQRLSELLNHEHAALSLAQRCSGVAAGLPLFTTLLNYRHANLLSQQNPQPWAWEGLEVLRSEERTNYPITVCIDDLGDGFLLTAQCTDGIDPGRIAGYLETALEHLTAALANRPACPVSQLSILPDTERRLVLA